MNSLSGAVAITKILFIVSIVSAAGIFSGCAGTAETTRVKLDYPHGSSAPTFRLTDVRPSERRIYRQTDSTQYLGDGNFEIPPVQVLTGYLNEKLGERLRGKEIILLEFQASITTPSIQTYPGMPIGTEALGRALRLPQLGNPHYAHVSLKVVLDQKEFTGAKSVSFQLGLGKSEIAEAMRAAIEEVIAVLQAEATNDAASPR